MERSLTAITIIGQWLHQSILLKPIGNLPSFFGASFLSHSKLNSTLSLLHTVEYWKFEKKIIVRFHWTINIYIHSFAQQKSIGYDTLALPGRWISRSWFDGTVATVCEYIRRVQIWTLNRIKAFPKLSKCSFRRNTNRSHDNPP